MLQSAPPEVAESALVQAKSSLASIRALTNNPGEITRALHVEAYEKASESLEMICPRCERQLRNSQEPGARSAAGRRKVLTGATAEDYRYDAGASAPDLNSHR